MLGSAGHREFPLLFVLSSLLISLPARSRQDNVTAQVMIRIGCEIKCNRKHLGRGRKDSMLKLGYLRGTFVTFATFAFHRDPLKWLVFTS